MYVTITKEITDFLYVISNIFITQNSDYSVYYTNILCNIIYSNYYVFVPVAHFYFSNFYFTVFE